MAREYQKPIDESEVAETAYSRDIVSLLAEYVNLPQTWATGGNPTLQAYVRFIASQDSFDWDAAERAIDELCATGHLCTLKQFRAVYFKYSKSTVNADGCEDCGKTGVVNIVVARNRKTGNLYPVTEAKPLIAYVNAIPCRCPKGRIVQDSFGMSNQEADAVYRHHRTRETCKKLARECVTLYYKQNGVKDYVQRNDKPKPLQTIDMTEILNQIPRFDASAANE